MVKLDAYMPIDRRFALIHDEVMPDRARGAVLFADISGFSSTASTLEEALGARQGADELMVHVNSLYNGLVGEVHRYGGSVISFGGDSMTCWFDDNVPVGIGSAPAANHSAQRATACALAMQEVVKRAQARQVDSSLEPDFAQALSLSIKVAVVAGRVRRFLVGSPESQYIEVLAGELLDRAAAAEQALQPGQVVVGAEVLAHFGRQLEVIEWIEGSNGEYFALIADLKEPVEPLPWSDLPPLAPEIARKWLLPPIYERLLRGEEEFLAELRPSVAIFLQFSGFNYDADDDAGEKLDVFVRWVQDVLEQYGGYLLQVTVGDKGNYAMASTSATRAHEDDALRAVSAVRAVLSLSPELNFITELKAGISWGTMLVGAYGGDIRRTFSEQGSETNLAARLMEAAGPGDMLISSAVAEVVHHEYELRDLGGLRLKGWAEAVPVFAVENRKHILPRMVESDPDKAPIVGREDELALFHHRIQAMKEGFNSAIVIEGEAGIGKSRLVSSFIHEAQAADVRAMFAAGDAIERATPFHAWRPVFREILQLEPNDTHTIVCERINAALAEQNGDLEHAAVLDNVLALSGGEEQPGVRLAGSTSADQVREMLLGILNHSANGHGQVIILDDAQWIDSASWALLNDARQIFTPLVIVVASRPIRQDVLLSKEFKALLSDPDTAHLDLMTLKPDESTTMVAQRLGVRSLPEPVAAFIRQRAGGHPFFSEEIAYALIDAGLLQLRGDESVLVTQNGDLDHLDFPDTVQGVIASRIDRLNAPTQLTLKVASVIGPTFTFENLYDVHPVAADKENLHEHLHELSRLDIAVADTSEGEAKYVFKHALIQEIAYGRLLIAQRKQLHCAIAEWLEKTHASNTDPYFPLLAYHWGSAARSSTSGDRDRKLTRNALHYADEAGAQALRNSTYREAINFYKEAIDFASHPALEISPKQHAHYLQQLGDAYHQWGQWSEARENLVQAAALYGRPLPTGQVGISAGMIWQILIQIRNRLLSGRYVGKAPEAEKETVLKIARLYQTVSELSFLTNDSALSLYAVLFGLNLSEYGGLSPEMVKAYSDICVIIGLFGPRRMAEAYGERAWRAAQILNDPAIQVSVTLGIGLDQLNAGKLDQAQASFEQALQISEELGDRRLWGDGLGLLARTIRFRGGLQRAGELYAKLGGPRSGVMMHRVWALNAQALVSLRQGDNDQAFDFLNQARSLPGERPEPQQEMITWAYLGIAYLRLGDWGRARESADQATALMEQVSASAYTHFEAFAAVAEIYMSLWEMKKDSSSAEAEVLAGAAREVCESLRRGTVKSGQPSSWLYRGWYSHLDGHPRRAYKHWQKGLGVAGAVGMRYELGRIHFEMGRHARADDLQREEHLQRAGEIFEEIGAYYYLQRTQAVLEHSLKRNQSG